MSIIAKKPESDGSFERIPDGTHQAVCYAIWDLGKQETSYQGQTKLQHKIIIAWEIAERIKSEGEYKGKRFVINKRYTLSLSEKATLKKDLESWRGKVFTTDELEGFDVEKIIGVNCLLSITSTEKDGKTYSNVASVMALPKNMEKITVENPNNTPEWVQKIQEKAVMNIHDIQKSIGSEPPVNFSDDAGLGTDENVPF